MLMIVLVLAWACLCSMGHSVSKEYSNVVLSEKNLTFSQKAKQKRAARLALLTAAKEGNKKRFNEQVKARSARIDKSKKSKLTRDYPAVASVGSRKISDQKKNRMVEDKEFNRKLNIEKNHGKKSYVQQPVKHYPLKLAEKRYVIRGDHVTNSSQKSKRVKEAKLRNATTQADEKVVIQKTDSVKNVQERKKAMMREKSQQRIFHQRVKSPAYKKNMAQQEELREIKRWNKQKRGPKSEAIPSVRSKTKSGMSKQKSKNLLAGSKENDNNIQVASGFDSNKQKNVSNLFSSFKKSQKTLGSIENPHILARTKVKKEIARAKINYLLVKREESKKVTPKDVETASVRKSKRESPDKQKRFLSGFFTTNTATVQQVPVYAPVHDEFVTSSERKHQAASIRRSSVIQKREERKAMLMADTTPGLMTLVKEYVKKQRDKQVKRRIALANSYKQKESQSAPMQYIQPQIKGTDDHIVVAKMPMYAPTNIQSPSGGLVMKRVKTVREDRPGVTRAQRKSASSTVDNVSGSKTNLVTPVASVLIQNQQSVVSRMSQKRNMVEAKRKALQERLLSKKQILDTQPISVATQQQPAIS
jgi:hypothetical protein